MPIDLEDANEASDLDDEEIEMDEPPVNLGDKPILSSLMYDY